MTRTKRFVALLLGVGMFLTVTAASASASSWPAHEHLRGTCTQNGNYTNGSIQLPAVGGNVNGPYAKVQTVYYRTYAQLANESTGYAWQTQTNTYSSWYWGKTYASGVGMQVLETDVNYRYWNYYSGTPGYGTRTWSPAPAFTTIYVAPGYLMRMVVQYKWLYSDGYLYRHNSLNTYRYVGEFNDLDYCWSGN